MNSYHRTNLHSNIIVRGQSGARWDPGGLPDGHGQIEFHVGRNDFRSGSQMAAVIEMLRSVWNQPWKLRDVMGYYHMLRNLFQTQGKIPKHVVISQCKTKKGRTKATKNFKKLFKFNAIIWYIFTSWSNFHSWAFSVPFVKIFVRFGNVRKHFWLPLQRFLNLIPHQKEEEQRPSFF